MSDTTTMLGKLAPPEARRDAVHVAVVPCVAGETLSPGDPVKLAGDGRAVIAGSIQNNNGIGVVDPFLSDLVDEGERFWLFLKPGTVSKLRHEWTHPAFDTVKEEPQQSEPSPFATFEDDAIEQCRIMGCD